MGDGGYSRIEYQPLTIYNSVRFEPGETIPKQVRFTFGADVSDDAKFQSLAMRPEHELTRELLNTPTLCGRLFELVGLQYPDVWALIEPLTPRLSQSWNRDVPGDVDIVCGAIHNGAPSFEDINGFQVKIRKQKGDRTVGDTGRGQADETAHMGFDRTVLLHMLVQEPSPCGDDYAASWNPIKNSVFIDSIKRTVGVMRQEIQNDNLPYGYTILGWGQAFGQHWQVCGGFTFEVIKHAPVRPFASAAARYRDELRASCALILSQHALSRPFIVNLSQHR